MNREVVPLALARLEKMIESRLCDSLSFGLDIDPIVKVKVLEEADFDASTSPEMQISALPADPEFYDGLVGRILETIDDLIVEEDELVDAELAGMIDGRESAEQVIDLTERLFESELGSIRVEESMPRCDWFVGRLRCHCCGHVSRSGDELHCETFLSAEPRGRQIGVGDELGLERGQVPGDFYLRARGSRDADPMHVVEGWECGQCNGVNWAEIVLEAGVVRSMWSVALTRDVVDRATYLSSECVEVASQLTGRPAWTLLTEDVLEILLERL